LPETECGRGQSGLYTYYCGLAGRREIKISLVVSAHAWYFKTQIYCIVCYPLQIPWTPVYPDNNYHNLYTQ